MNKKPISSTRQVLMYMMAFIVLLFAFAVAYTYSTFQIINRKNFETNHNTLKIDQVKLENNLKTIEDSMANLVATDTRFIQLTYQTHQLNAHLYSYDIIQLYKQLISSNNISGAMFIYSEKNNIYRSTYGKTLIDINEKYSMDKYIKNFLYGEEEVKKNEWFLVNVENRYYLFRIMGMRDTYSVCAVDLATYIQNVTDAILIFTLADGTPLSSIDFINETGIKLTDSTSYYISGENTQYFIVQSYSDYLGLNIVYATVYDSILRTIEPIHFLMLTSLVVLIILLWLSLYLTNRHFLSPLNHMVETMERIQHGDLQKKMVTSFRNKELVKVSETFNETMEQINKLKIDAYEREIEIKDAHMQYLQIQIRPHFYMNCLSSLFGMAETGKNKQLQETILALSNYLRGTFENSNTMSSIENEIINIEKYLDFRQWNDSIFFTCNTNINSDIKDCMIPTLTILTFIENSFKHAKTEIKRLKININAKKIYSDDGLYANITIIDNGKGFSKELLKILNDKKKILTMKKNIGISNVVKRLSLAYDNRGSVVFSNAGGACVDIFIPLEEV